MNNDVCEKIYHKSSGDGGGELGKGKESKEEKVPRKGVREEEGNDEEEETKYSDKLKDGNRRS